MVGWEDGRMARSGGSGALHETLDDVGAAESKVPLGRGESKFAIRGHRAPGPDRPCHHNLALANMANAHLRNASTL